MSKIFLSNLVAIVPNSMCLHSEGRRPVTMVMATNYCLYRTMKHYLTPTQEDTVVRIRHCVALIKTIFIVCKA